MEKIMFLDLATLQVYSWLLIGLLTAAFAFLDGFDLGIAGMLPFAARSETEKRIMLNTMGPVWESNQVWFVVLGGTVFAAFPLLYAMAFSGFYLAMFLVLITLILRPIGFKFRAKVPNKHWRQMWDTCLCLGGFVGPLIFGVAIGNLLLGTPFHYDEYRRGFYEGGLIGLLQPFAILCGLCAIAMCLMQGGLFLNVKTTSSLQLRMQKIAQFSAVTTMLLFVVAGFWLANAVVGYQIDENEAVVTGVGYWMGNYQANPVLWLIPGGVVLSLALCAAFVRYRELLSFFFGSVSVIGIIATCGVTLFPFLMTSSTDPIASLTIRNASTSHMSLFVLFLFSIVFIPLIITYVSWVFYVVRGKIDASYLLSEDSSY